MVKYKYVYFVLFLSFLLVAYFFILPRNLFNTPHSTVIFSSDNRLLGAKIASDGQWRFPQTDSVPYKFKQAIITFEDKRFYNHFGIDPLAIARALRQNLRRNGVVSGASTLTMQTIRLSRNKTNRSIWEKVIESILATRLEFRLSKEEILSKYASYAPFGGNVVGLDAAAWRYFGRSAEMLSWAESAMLAVLPNAPSMIHLGNNRDALKKKRDSLLDKMKEASILDDIECELAKEEILPDKPYPMPMFAPHLLERVKKEMKDSVVRTTLDYDLQLRVNDIATRHNKIFRTNKVENMAILVTDVTTGDVLAYVGNIYELGDTKRGSNVDIIPAPRSSGSTLKPFLYAGMLDDATILPTMLLPDIPHNYGNFTPRNFNNTFDGAVPAHRVLERSLNIPSVRMLDIYGQEKFLKLLNDFEFSTINKGAEHYGLSLILGGAEITMWDLTNAYTLMSSKLKNYGLRDYTSKKISFYNEPHAEVKVRDMPLSAASLWLTFEALSDVNRPEEEGEWKIYGSSRKIAWKTGTSYGNRDAWSIGITPEYVVCVWVGNSSGEGRPLLTGVGYASPVLFDVFGVLPNTSWYSMPENDMEQVEVCSKSGYQLTPVCESADTLWLPKISRQALYCPYHKEVNISSDMRYRVNSDCYPISQMKRMSWFVLPPAMEWYYKQKNINYKPLPPLHPAISSVEDNPIEIIYPQPKMVVVSPRGLDGKAQSIVFNAVHSIKNTTIFWHLNNQYLGSTTREHKMSILISEGKHILTLIDDRGAKTSVTFYGE